MEFHGGSVKRGRTGAIERTIELAMAPGSFIGERAVVGLVRDLSEVKSTIVQPDGGIDAARRIRLLETLIAACYLKAEELDDSGGSFGMFVEELFCDWIRARQAGGADPAETIRMLLSWIDSDDYGYCHEIEKKVVAALDDAGLRAFEAAVEGRRTPADRNSYPHRRKIQILKAIHRQRLDAGAFAGLCDREGGYSPKDCEALAKICIARDQLEDALGWVDRGLGLERRRQWGNESSWNLHGLKRDILVRLGRSGDALASAWEEYQHAPSVYRYETLMKFVPAGEEGKWRAKAISRIERADLGSKIPLLVALTETERLATVVDGATDDDLVALSHSATEPAAELLAESRPALAARLYVAAAERVLAAKKSKYYGAALGNLVRARKLLVGRGGEKLWEAYARRIATEHRAKSSFMPGFKRLLAGRTRRPPSFLAQARRRWRRGARPRSRSE